jgi:hypothetical protein
MGSPKGIPGQFKEVSGFETNIPRSTFPQITTTVKVSTAHHAHAAGIDGSVEN